MGKEVYGQARASTKAQVTFMEVVSLRQLQYFVEVATTGSFTAAAERLNVSQPAVGIQIKKLEERLGMALLHRHSRGISLTSAGEAYLHYVEKALDTLTEAEQVLHRYRKGEPAKVRMGVPPTIERMLLPKLLTRVGLMEGEFSIRLTEGLSDRHFDQILQGELDCAFCYDVQPAINVSITPLYSEDIYVVGPPAVVGPNDEPFDFRGLANLPLVLSPKSNPFRARVDETAGQLGFSITPDMEFTLPGLKREVLLRSGYCALSPYGLFLADIKSGVFSARKLANPVITRTMHLVVNRKVPALTAQRLSRAVRELFEDMLGEADLRWRKVK